MRMDLNLSAKLQLQQKQVLAPQMIQAIEILQFPMANLLDYVEQQLSENDALVVDTPDEVRSDDEDDDTAESPPTDAEVAEWSPDDWDEWRPPKRNHSDEPNGKMEALQNTAGRSASLQDLLAAQLGMLDAPERLAKLARVLIYNLDDRGYLPPHRFVETLLESTDDDGYLSRTLADVVTSVDGVAAIKVPEAKRGVTPEQIVEAEEQRDRNILEAQGVLSLIQSIRAMPGGNELARREILLRYPLEEILQRERADWTIHEAEQALALVQSLDPRGVAGRTLSETLVMQLDPTDLLYREKKRLLEDHLEDLEKNRMQRIAREMNLDLEEIQMLVDEFRGLDPRPGGELAPVSARTVHPDVFVEQIQDGSFQVDLVNSYLPPLAVSMEAVEFATDKAQSDRIRNLYRKRIESARWLIEAIRQRQQTLTRVAQRIFYHQRAYLDRGDDALRPLKMQTVADELGIHVSTVSRAIADKYVQTPFGVRALKFFFTGGTETASGEVESRNTVKNKVKAIIDAEDRTKPLSDDDVASRLKEQGLSIARRTVTKYRKQLSIPSSRQRRQWV